MNNSNTVTRGLFWKLLERFGVSGIQFILQIILARLLDPAHYGALSIMIIFTSLANVFIQHGLNTALIQNKDVDEDDYSSVFWLLLGMAGVFYGIIFVAAPAIGRFYDMPYIVLPLRVLALMLFPGSLNAVQLAKISREMEFKKVFYSNVGAILVSGLVGITIALSGGGLWALVAQNVMNTLVACAVMFFTTKLKIRLVFNIRRVKVLFSYGWKLMISSLLDTLYTDLNSLIIGWKYSSSALGYYNRGQQFPQFIMSAVNSSVQSVMLPFMSSEQDNLSKVKHTMRTSISVGSYVIFPIMMGLAMVAPSLVSVLLTDKWLPCVPYLQICCITFAFFPVHSCNLQAINAIGRSDVFLKLEIIKKFVSISLLISALLIFDSPLAIAISGAIGVPFGLYINSFPNKKLIGYSFWDQLKDWMPALLLSLIMGVIVWLVGLLKLNTFLLLVLQIITGIAVYILLLVILKPRPYKMIVYLLKDRIKKA